MSSAAVNESLKFDLHGFVTVRLVGAHPRDVHAVARQLGPIQVADDSAAVDITLRFVDRIGCRSPLRYLGNRHAGFTDDAFLVLRSKHKAQTRTLIPMEHIGGPCEITCEHGTPAVPLLLAIVNLTAASKGVLPLHAAAFDWHGIGTIVTGWSKGGKTETLLAFVSRGARYVADEWCYVARDGERIFGIPEPVRVWRWQLAQLPEIRRRVPFSSRSKMTALGIIPAIQQSIPRRWQAASIGRAAQRVAHFVEQYQNTLIPPEHLFGDALPMRAPKFDRLVFILSAQDTATVAQPIAPAEVADRMVHSLRYERQTLEHYYRMFRFAFPDASNPRLERIDQTELDLLRRVFEGKPAIRVEHPYPVRFDELYECLASFVSE